MNSRYPLTDPDTIADRLEHLYHAGMSVRDYNRLVLKLVNDIRVDITMSKGDRVLYSRPRVLQAPA